MQPWRDANSSLYGHNNYFMNNAYVNFYSPLNKNVLKIRHILYLFVRLATGRGYAYPVEIIV